MAIRTWIRLLAFGAYCLASTFSAPAQAGRDLGTPAEQLTTELVINPMGLDTRTPRFSWKMKPRAGARGQCQSGYRILVATVPGLLKEGQADVWDSATVKSDQSVLVGWDSQKIRPRTRYYWSVKLCDEASRWSDYAPPVWFEAGILDQQDWYADGAKWIESPLEPVRDAEFDEWAKYTIFRLQYQYGGKDKPGPEAFDAAVQHCYENLRDKVWPGSLLRHEFAVSSVKRARLYISGLGYYRAYLNGRKIGERDLAPSDSHFFAHVYYQVYDVSDLVKNGENCLGVELVNGRWRAWPGNTAETYHDRPILMARLELTDERGHVTRIVSNEDWRCGQHAIRRHGFWIGELFDSRIYPTGWNTTDFDSHDWVPARPTNTVKEMGSMTLDPMQPEKMCAPIPPVKQTEPKPHVYVYDFGQMVGGRAKFTFQGLKRGQHVIVRYAETIDTGHIDAPYAIAYYSSFVNTRQEPGLLKFKRRGSTGSETTIKITRPDGSTQIGKLSGGATAYTDMYVASGGAQEVWTPNFTYTGFRYLEILGLDAPPPLSDVAAYDIRTTPEVIGSLRTDNAKLNRILKGVQDTILCCFHSQLQDNNGAERNPNALNLALNDLNIAYWLNVHPLWLKGALDTDKMNSYVGYCANMICGMRDLGIKKKREINISNSLHMGHLPWDLISFYNDERTAESLLKWVLFFVKETSEYTVWETMYGSADHIATSSLKGLPSKGWVRTDRLTDPQFVKSGFIIRIARMGIEVAEKLNRPAEANELKRLLAVFEARVKKTYFDAPKGEWTPGYPTIQGRDLTLMYFMMQPRRNDQELCAEIVKEIHAVTGGHQVTGSRLSYPLLHELSQNGYQDEAMRLLMREEYPSLLEMIHQTGNTIRESWGTGDSFAQIEGLTEMGKWFYTDLVGIEPSLERPAFATFTLKPMVPAGVTAYVFSYDSPRGIIQSNWKEKQGTVVWEVVVPPNAVAKVFIPAKSRTEMKEGGKPAAEQKGIAFLKEANGLQILEVQSGVYTFSFQKGQ